MRQTLRTFLLVILLVPLSGCSTFGFFFERLDWLIVWRADSMFDLTRKQEKALKPKAIEFREWLRNGAFPHIEQELDASLSYWEKNERFEAYLYLEQSLKEFTPEFLTNIAPMLGAISHEFTERNAKQFREFTEENYEDWFEYAESDEAKAAKRIEKLDDWFGDLSDEQIEIVVTWSALEPNEREIRIENSLQWREKYIQAALAGDVQLVDQWIKQPEIWWTDDYQLIHQRNRDAVNNTLKALMPTLTEEQTSQAKERVNEWIENLADTRA